MGDRLGWAVAAGDFNGDGFDDLAIGVPYEDKPLPPSGTLSDYGVVELLYGSAEGVDLAGAQFWSQDTPGVLDQAEPFDRFGAVLAAGNFNGDAYDDLAIGVFYEDEGADDAGVVQVLYGTADGLSASGDQLWSQDAPGVLGASAISEWFGYSLATGDFDGDGYDDLAIGVPFEESADTSTYGGVNVLFGSALGLTSDGDQLFDANEVSGAYEVENGFGWSLAAGDFDGDGISDLAIGAPYDDFVGLLDVGSVRVLFGSALGLTLDGNLYLLGPQATGRMGDALAAGDLDGDGDDDLAIGIPLRTVGGHPGAGSVWIRLGDGGQLLDGGEFHQNSTGVLGTAEDEDHFGAALTCGDFDGDGRSDLAIGVPEEDLGEADEGAVQVLFGSVSGLTAARNQLWLRDNLPIPDPSPTDVWDRFGFALAAGDFDGTGHADLAIGSPGEALGTPALAGAAIVLYGFLFADGFESGSTSAWSTMAP